MILPGSATAHYWAKLQPRMIKLTLQGSEQGKEEVYIALPSRSPQGVIARVDTFRGGYYAIIADDLYDLAKRGYLGWSLQSGKASRWLPVAQALRRWCQEQGLRDTVTWHWLGYGEQGMVALAAANAMGSGGVGLVNPPTITEGIVPSPRIKAWLSDSAVEPQYQLALAGTGWPAEIEVKINPKAKLRDTHRFETYLNLLLPKL